jgi:hypothetical protein
VVIPELKIYSPLVNGYAFVDGSGVTGTVAKTTGVFNLVTGPITINDRSGNPYKGDTSGKPGYFSTGKDNTKVNPKFVLGPSSLYLYASFDFTKDSSNYKICNGVFDISKNYIGTLANPAYTSQGVIDPVSGLQNIEIGFHDFSNNIIPVNTQVIVPGVNLAYPYDASRNFVGYQPVIKSLYYPMVNNYVLNDAEANELCTTGGGIYTSISYDSSSDVLIIPVGNINHACYDYEVSTWNALYEAQKVFPGQGAWAGANMLDSSYNTKILGSIASAFNMYNYFSNVRATPIDGTVYGYHDASKNSVQVAQKIMRYQYQYWLANKKIRDRKVLNFGPYFERQCTDGFIGLSGSSGELLFKIDTQGGVDAEEHSVGFNALSSKYGVFHGAGPNQDANAATVVRSKEVAGGWSLTDPSGNPGAWLVAAGKSRIMVFDYNKLFNKLTPLDAYPNDKQYVNGIKKNTAFDDAIVYEELATPSHAIISYNPLSCDGKTIAFKPGVIILDGPQSLTDWSGNSINEYGHIIDPDSITVNSLFGNNLSSVSSNIYAYDLANIVNKPANSLPPRSMKWISNAELIGFADIAGTFIYGSNALHSCKNGELRVIDIDTGVTVQTIVNSEGFTSVPLLADGVIYGYGGTSNWTERYGAPAPPRINATKLNMWTPNGK